MLADLLGSLGGRALIGVHRVSDQVTISRVGWLEFVDAGEFVEVGACADGGIVFENALAKDAARDARYELRHCCVRAWRAFRGEWRGSVRGPLRYERDGRSVGGGWRVRRLWKEEKR